MSELSGQATRRRTDHAQDTLIEVEGLKKYFGGEGMFADPPVKAVDGVNFEIRRGETLGLVGESGCGKTTLGRLLVRLESATEGSIAFDGTDVTTLSGNALKEWRPNAQIVFQDPESSLNDRMTVGSIIREPLDVHDWEEPADRRERVMELLGEVGLEEDHYYRYPHQFSGGQRQRIGIARALALEPEFVVLDEPVSALDASVQARILNLLEDLQEEHGLTYLFIAHDLSVVRHICDRVAVMYLGKVMEIGETEELYTDPANPYTYSLLSAIPVPDPSADRDRITLSGTPPSPRDPPTGCQFCTRCPAKIRPEEQPALSAATRQAIEQFRDEVRRRARADLSAGDRLRRRLGLFSAYDDIDETTRDAFGDVDAPQRVRDTVETAAEQVREGYPERAEEYLSGTFDDDRGGLAGLSEETWEAIERFREVVRERDRADLSTRDRLRRRAGLFSKYDDIDETVDDLFGEVEMPAAAMEHIEEAAEMVKNGYPARAREYLGDEFDSVCDAEEPELYEVGDGDRLSYCHRHRPEYEDARPVLERRSDAY